jgi:hypothetical protein
MQWPEAAAGDFAVGVQNLFAESFEQHFEFLGEKPVIRLPASV